MESCVIRPLLLWPHLPPSSTLFSLPYSSRSPLGQAHTLYGHHISDSLFLKGLFPPFFASYSSFKLNLLLSTSGKSPCLGNSSSLSSKTTLLLHLIAQV